MRRNPQFPFSPISRDQALQLYDEGKQIYLVRTSLRPTIVTERVEIERGSDVFQIATAELELEKSREESLLQSSEKQFGIYQITERDPEHDYRFMGLDYVQKKGITVARADYDLIYAAPLTEKDTLDGIYERFNIQRPADFTGHSLSVSDVVVLNDGESVKAYYVDSIGFAELPDFFKERNIDLQKENLLNEELQEIEIFDKPGLFSNGRLRDEDVPEGLYRYDLRGSDYDPGQPITVEKTVVVNHAASVLMAEELDLGAEGRLELGEEGLNFTGAELTVREFMEEQQQKNNALIHGDSYHIAVEGHIGTWYAIDETEVGGEKFFLLEHEEHGDMAACVAVNEQGKLVAEDLWNGFDEDFQEAVQKYFSEKWNMPKKEDVVSEIIEKAVPVPNNSEKDYSDVPVYYEPFSYAKENDEVDLYRTSYRLNSECKQAIHEAIADNYDGMYLGDGAVDQVVRQYGMERVGYILANTLHHKSYDDRFSHSNKEWAEQVSTPEHNADRMTFRTDWVVDSHPAILDGFVTMYREELDAQKELEQEQPFVKQFYVVENLQAVPLKIERFGNLDDAMSQYQALPNHCMKALGVEKNPDPLPGSLDILQCKNGIDTINIDDYKKQLEDLNGKSVEDQFYGLKTQYIYPLIEKENIIYIPSPYLVINAVTESMLNRVTFGDEQLRREFGKEVIESYLYDITSQVKTVSWISKEIVYNVGHQEIRSPDVLVGEGEKMTFYDTKAFSPSLRLRSLDRTEIENDIARYAKNVIQLYKQIVNYLAGKFELDKHYEKKDIFGVVVVLEDAVVSRKKVYDKVFLELERTAHLDDEEKRYIHSHIKVLPLREVETFMLQNMSPLPFLVEQVENENQWDNYRYGCPQKENGLIAEYESYVKKLKSMLIARIRTV